LKYCVYSGVEIVSQPTFIETNKNKFTIAIPKLEDDRLVEL